MKKETEEKMEAWLHDKPERYKSPDVALYALVQSIVNNKEEINADILADSMHKFCPEWGERKVQAFAEQKNKEIWLLADFYKYIKK